MSALTFLGLAKRAGRLESGDDAVNMTARAGKAKLILTASDAGRSSALRAKNSAEAAKCPVAAVPFTKEELGAALGRDTVGVAALTDVGLAHAFRCRPLDRRGYVLAIAAWSLPAFCALPLEWLALAVML